MKYDIRELNIEEFDKLNNLWPLDDNPEIKADRYAKLTYKVEQCFVVAKDDELIGEISVVYKSGDELETIKNKRVYLQAFRIHEKYQGCGLGKELMEFVLGYCEKNGYTEFTIGVEDDNETAKHIYKNFGFTNPIRRCYEKTENYQCEYDLLLRKK